MGTCNFARPNTSMYYVIDTDDEDVYADIRNSIEHTIEEVVKTKPYTWYVSYGLCGECNRNYPEMSIGSIDYNLYITDSTTEEEYELIISVVIKTVSGYYSGFILDYDINLELPAKGSISDSGLDDLLDWAEIEANTNDVDDIKSTIQEIKNTIESVFKDFTDKYECLGTFSNGEAVYKEVEG
jgi:hypothetical protein